MTQEPQMKRTGEADHLVIPVSSYLELMRVMKPSVYLLHSAVWRAGLSVNGMKPN